MAMEAAMDGAIAAAVAIITDGAEVIAVITMAGRAVATAAGAKSITGSRLGWRLHRL
jgi:hypothetical protein